ncbi:hypothetical protein DdX_14721 [Ditylenchus destructor]|uniref:Secreted protein n=1 Tax=Ditylenchus destructor TaxID=166010 RepID=A0AAD4MWD7_9BILA|nr:hypothetical protein DdX_14721 [Ditylenchus destructor]
MSSKALVSFVFVFIACTWFHVQAQPIVGRPYTATLSEIPFSCRSTLIANACEMAGGVCSRRNPYRPWEIRVCTFPNRFNAVSNEAKQKQNILENSPMFDGFRL